ncbi:MAG: GNAT family N-acetyltransferase [Patescibacteria group bacterium]
MIRQTLINVRQTPLYADFMRRINWKVEKIDGGFAYIKKIPLIPAIIKIQRPQKLPSFDNLKKLAQKYKTKSIIIEPKDENFKFQISNFKLLNDPYIHTKSIHVDLTPLENVIFNHFTPAKRRAVRKAEKLGVQVEISDNIDAFIRLKNSTTGIFLGFLTTRGVTRPLWQTFYPRHARVVLGKVNDKYVAGILLLYIEKVAYYWMAAATSTGKKHFAPTLLTWEAFKFAKKTGCTMFDFEGVYDERFPKKSRDWRGFSKFKEGFGGCPIYYPQPFKIQL